MDSAQGSDLAPFFGALTQIEKNSEIKPPLGMKRHILRRTIFFIDKTYTYIMSIGPHFARVTFTYTLHRLKDA